MNSKLPSQIPSSSFNLLKHTRSHIMIILGSFALTKNLCLGLYLLLRVSSLWHALGRPKDTYYKTGDPARLPARLLGDGYKGSEIEYDEEKKYLVLCRLKQPRQNKNLLYRHDEPNKPTKEGPPFHLYSVSPHSPQFQHSQHGPSLSIVSLGSPFVICMCRVRRYLIAR